MRQRKYFQTCKVTIDGERLSLVPSDNLDRLEETIKNIQNPHWIQDHNKAMETNVLDRFSLSGDVNACKQKCWQHRTKLCQHITLYRNTLYWDCYLHEGSYDQANAKMKSSIDAHTHTLQLSIDDHFTDSLHHSQQTLLLHRWQMVQGPMTQLEELVDFYLGAIKSLTGKLEEVDSRIIDVQENFVSLTDDSVLAGLHLVLDGFKHLKCAMDEVSAQRRSPTN